MFAISGEKLTMRLRRLAFKALLRQVLYLYCFQLSTKSCKTCYYCCQGQSGCNLHPIWLRGGKNSLSGRGKKFHHLLWNACLASPHVLYCLVSGGFAPDPHQGLCLRIPLGDCPWPRGMILVLGGSDASDCCQMQILFYLSF